MSCLLWVDQFYEDGVTIAQRIEELVPQVKKEVLDEIVIDMRTNMKLRHAPLLVCAVMAKHKLLRGFTLESVIQRADELAEFLAIYWRNGKCPLSKQVKIGLARAFTKFSEYDLAKYNRDGNVKLRDVLFLCHAKPKDKKQANLWKRLVNKELKTPDTWEVALSGGKDKKETWERLIKDEKLGALALLRNLRNMDEVGVDKKLIKKYLTSLDCSRVLPFRFITAARYAPDLETELEQCMFKAIDEKKKFKGNTIILVDVSGSMDNEISGKSEITRIDAACGVAMLARELCNEGSVLTFSEKCVLVPSRKGFALRDVIENSQEHSGTNLGEAIRAINAKFKYDRIIVITDEQSHDNISPPIGKGYIINVASCENGVGYGQYTHINGWSESVLDYIKTVEK
jgi:hypothetical protein